MTKKDKNPTIFVLEGTIRCYEDGSMLQLQSLITSVEWEAIVEETVKYKLFVDSLKETGCPLLGEPWDEEDDWFRLQLDVAVSRMRSIDPLLLSKHDQKAIRDKYDNQIRANAPEVLKLIEQVREDNKQLIRQKYGLDGNGNTMISNL